MKLWLSLIMLLNRNPIQMVLTMCIVLVFGGVAFMAIFLMSYSSSRRNEKIPSAYKIFDDYVDARARITELSEEEFSYRPYTPKPEEKQTISQYPDVQAQDININGISLDNAGKIKEAYSRNALLEIRQRRVLDELDKNPRVKKIRYKIKYTFDTADGEAYEGEGLLYTIDDSIEVGKYIDIKYKPTNPRASFIATSMKG